MGLDYKRTPVVVILSITIVLASLLAVQTFIAKKERGPLRILVDGKVYSDDDFSEGFDYSTLVDREVYFVEPVVRAKFVKAREEESFEVDELGGVWAVIDGLDMPKVVRGIAKLVCNGTYEDAVATFNASPEHGIGLHIGDRSGLENKNGFIYEIYRRVDSGVVERLEIIEIWKMYQHDPGKGGTCYRMEIEIDNIPPMVVEVIKTPWHSGTR